MKIGMAAVALLGLGVLYAADWLNEGGDALHSNWQKHGKQIKPGNAGSIRLLWKRQLDDTLSAPVILGPVITHRGVRELVLVAGAGDNFYAIDADLGTLFWKRHFEGGGSARACVTTPAISPDPDGDDYEDPPNDEMEPNNMRPVFALANDGRLHSVRVSDGADVAPPRAFLSPGATAGVLTAVGTAEAPKVETAPCGGGTRTATWEDEKGVRWNFTAGPDSVKAAGWTSRPITAPAAPVIQNGVVLVLEPGSAEKHAVLYGLDAVTGKELFSSGDAIGSFVKAKSLAVANGHICFTAVDKVVYCFGIPIER